MDLHQHDLDAQVKKILDMGVTVRKANVTIPYFIEAVPLPTIFRYRGVFFERVPSVSEGTSFKLSWTVFANGCFDYLHLGHIRLLRQAYEEYRGTVIIGLNSDMSYKALRGCLPVFDERQRKEMLLALKYVSSVHVFSSEEELRNLVISVRPSVLLKGGDYRDKPIVGEEYVAGYGGEVRRDFYVGGFSSGWLKDTLMNRMRRGTQ